MFVDEHPNEVLSAASTLMKVALLSGISALSLVLPALAADGRADSYLPFGPSGFVQTLYSRLNDKRSGAIVIIMQRLHEDDLVGHMLGQKAWEVVSFPAIAEVDEVPRIETIWEPRCFTRRPGEALHPEREPLFVLQNIRRTIGECNFAGQYQQSPAPLGGGLVKVEWFKRYNEKQQPERSSRSKHYFGMMGDENAQRSRVEAKRWGGKPPSI